VTRHVFAQELRSRPSTPAWPHRAGTPMRTAIQPQLRSRLHPRPTGGAAFVAGPLLALKHARRRRGYEVTFGARHSSGAFVPRYFRRLGRSFPGRAVGPGARQVPVFVTVLLADLHQTLMLPLLRESLQAIRACIRRARQRFGVRQPQLPLSYVRALSVAYESGSCGYRTPNCRSDRRIDLRRFGHESLPLGSGRGLGAERTNINGW
jgi:hypothetical protein